MTDSARYYIAKALGAFWLLDGLLQFQPAMFGPSFVSQVLKPVLSGQPGFLDTIVDWGIRFWNLNTVASDIAAALLQIAIGLALSHGVQARALGVDRLERRRLAVRRRRGTVVDRHGELLHGSAGLRRGLRVARGALADAGKSARRTISQGCRMALRARLSLATPAFVLDGERRARRFQRIDGSRARIERVAGPAL